MKDKNIYIEIDELTNSIKNSVTGELFDTKVERISISDSHLIKADEWIFDWHAELNISQRKIFKLTTKNNPNIIHALISLQIKSNHVFIHLIESASFNKGTNKIYVGVAGNLFAYACKLSFENRLDVFVAFDSKSALIDHYKNKLGATHFRGQRMFIEPVIALKLVNKYFKQD